MAQSGAVPGATGRLLGSDNLQRAVDATERTITKLNTALSRLAPGIDQLVSGANSYRAGGKATSWNSASNWKGTNGGGSSFGGNGGQQPNSHRAPGNASWWSNTGSGGQRSAPANGGGATFGGSGSGGGGGSHRAPGGSSWGPNRGSHRGSGNGVANAAFAVGAAVKVARNIDNAIGQPNADAAIDSRLMLATADVNSLGQSVNYNSLYAGQRTAMNTSDLVASTQILAGNTGYTLGSAGFKKMQNAVQSTSLINPLMSQQQSAAGMVAFQTPRGFNGLRSVGVNTIGPGGVKKSPTQIAQQVLNQVDPGQKVQTAEQIAMALNDPTSGLNQTLTNWAANGIIDANQLQVIKDQIKGILLARQKGMNSATLESTMNAANNGDKKASKTLASMGIGNSALQAEKDLSSSQRTDTTQQLKGFNDGLIQSTKALGDFQDAMNQFMTSTGLDTARGKVKGNTANGPIGAAPAAHGIGQNILKFIGIDPNLGMGGSSETRMSVTSGGGGGTSASPHVAGGTGVGGPVDSGVQGRLSPSASKTGAVGAQRTDGGAASSGRLTWPAKGPITARWGQKGKQWSSGYHTGLDIGIGTGTPVKAAAAGTVTVAGFHSAYGNQIVIDHGNGISTQYAHNSKIVTGVGSQVRQGQLISYSGATGNVTGAHLHFEVRINGKDVDPLKYLNGAPLAVSSNSVSTSASSGTGTQSTTGSGSGTPYGATNNTYGVGTTEASVLASALAGGFASAMASSSASSAAPSTSAPGSSTGNPATGSGASSSAPNAPTNVTGNRKIVMDMAAAKGWTGAQWNSLNTLVEHESGFKNTAQNPTSTAYGMFQFLDGTWKGFGSKTSDPTLQTKYGLAYIQQRYKDPVGAWDFWKKHNWYDKGAWSIKQDETATVHKGEMVIPKAAADQIRDVLMQGNPYGSTGPNAKTSGQGVVVQFATGAIQVILGAGATPAQGQAIGKSITDAIAADTRIQALQNGGT